jgi:hypothetical protein
MLDGHSFQQYLLRLWVHPTHSGLLKGGIFLTFNEEFVILETTGDTLQRGRCSHKEKPKTRLNSKNGNKNYF